MYEVATREIPERSLLCLKRTVDEQGQWGFGKEFIGIWRQRPLPLMEGRAGASFCIWWSHPSADSDGLIEWCRPVPQTEAAALAERYPELTLRTEPAHTEAFVTLPGWGGSQPAVHWQLARPPSPTTTATSPSRSLSSDDRSPGPATILLHERLVRCGAWRRS